MKSIICYNNFNSPMLQRIKKTLSNIGLIALILGSLFAVCYLPTMRMASAQNMASGTSRFTKTEQCCKTQNNHHTLAAIGIPASPINLENLLILLGLSLLSLIGADTLLAVKKFINAKLLNARQFRLKLFNYLIQFFSTGVLHPKLYNA